MNRGIPMANSKSNIYPIQLQGAELCLNRYDAEIKQYRGFNKNNSPFVGGCLSNVFTKEEQISGGNADNTYINTNGDVYRVDTEGLYQNDNKIIEYPSTVKFYEKEKVDFNKDVVYAISDKIYITIEENIQFPRSVYEGILNPYTMAGYVAHWGDGHSAVICSVKSFKQSFFEIEKKGEKIVFSIKKYIKESGTIKAALHIVYIPDEENSESTKFGPERADPNHPASVVYSANCRLLVTTDSGNYKSGDLSHATYMANNYFAVAQNSPSTSYLFCFYYNDIENVLYSTTFTTTTTHAYISNNFNSYFMTNEGILYLYKTNGEYTFSVSSQGSYFVTSFKLDMQNDTFNCNVFVTDMWLTSSWINNKKINTAQVYGLFKPWGCSFTSFMPFTGTGETQGLYISRCNHIRNLAIHNEDGIYKNITGAVILKNGFKILIYNNEVVNISILDMYTIPTNAPDMWRPRNNFNGVIIEQWNEIEYFYIYDDYIFYKLTDGGFYIVKESVPKMKLKNSQLVVNCNYEKNAYDLSDNVIKHFGSDWNCAYLACSNFSPLGDTGSNYLDSSSSYIIDKNLTNLYWVASAVNEQSFNSKNNSSLILNKQSFVNDFSFKFIGVKTSWFGGDNTMSFAIADYIQNGAVNVYFNGWDGQGQLIPDIAYYLGSGNIGQLQDPELMGLTYPDNTDGNVQLNPSLFSEFITNFSNDVFVKENVNVYQLMKMEQENIMSYFLGTLIEGLELVFILQGQYYGIIENKLFGLQFNNGVVADSVFIVNIQGLQFVGNTPYEALFFSKTNRCLYSFTGANVLNQKQLVDKISEVRNYLYNPATQTVFLITDIGVLFYGLFGMFLLEYTDITNIFLLDNGIVMSDNSGNYRYVKYYLDEGDTDYTKENINVETSFYGMNNEVVTINDCLYFRIFSEEHEEGDLKVSATTISLRGRKTEETTFKIKASDWDKITHTIYLRYQPKTQRGLGVAFAIDSPFKIASLSVGSQPDAVLVDKVSKGAITAPSVTTNNNEW